MNDILILDLFWLSGLETLKIRNIMPCVMHLRIQTNALLYKFAKRFTVFCDRGGSMVTLGNLLLPTTVSKKNDCTLRFWAVILTKFWLVRFISCWGLDKMDRGLQVLYKNKYTAIHQTNLSVSFILTYRDHHFYCIWSEIDHRWL